MLSEPGRIVASHIQLNRSTLERHDEFAEHRQKLMELIHSVGTSSTDRLCIFGSGNCNDIRLDELLASFGHVHLVDLDREVLKYVQSTFNASHLTVQQADVTGFLDLLDAIDSADVSDESIESIRQAASSPACEIDHGPFDVVVSSCLLTQIFNSLVMAFGQHDRLNELIFAARHQHLRMMIQSLKPGGSGLLITDFTDSISVPELPHIPTEQFADAMLQTLIANNFFTGANPLAIMKMMQQQTEFADTSHHNVTQPWRWDIGTKQMAVSGIQFLRAK